MADTLAERVTGRPADAPTPVTVNLVMSDQALLGGGDDPAVIDGYGPVPAAVARSRVGPSASTLDVSRRRKVMDASPEL